MIKSRLRCAGHVARMEESKRQYFKILTDKPTGKRLLEKFKCRWEEDIRLDLKEMGISTKN